jgi:tetratricopeptide (TPR) repeat protein
MSQSVTANRLRAMAAAAALLATPGLAAADAKAEARPHIERASSLHAAGKYSEALKELTLAYALDPQPQLLYAIAQVHVKLGDCDSAIAFYQRFLSTNPDASDAAIARQAIARCASQIPRSAEPSPPVEPRVQPRSVEPAAPPEPAPAPAATAPDAPHGHDWLGWTLTTAGVAAGIGGGLVYLDAVSTRNSADHAPSYTDYANRIHDAHDKQTISLVVFGGAAALAAGGLIHLVLHDSGEHSVAIIPARGGAVAAWAARF